MDLKRTKVSLGELELNRGQQRSKYNGRMARFVADFGI